jgi:hypothetical protein
MSLAWREPDDHGHHTQPIAETTHPGEQIMPLASVPADEFDYRVHKDGTVRIAWRGRVVKTLAGPAAARFLVRVEGAEPAVAQLAMAKATGNFKRGNERQPGRP